METNNLIDLLKYQEFFNTNLEELTTLNEDDVNFINQTHFGDLIVEESNIDGERYNLYRSLDENVAQGEALIQIEHSGKNNNYSYETVLNFYL
ncbi:hypothetical protein M1M25_gp004 [Tenacibaculum phage Gundel_1]|uniref:Uncharacterized protein n=1 Tax=Tenacibaculum phage Gundel_1 TaxID=2745672 RepID=A0A8E4ZMV9_9CAUD|nr:hypothetical protein M1M25_gp004 [Tenacibaculum phage Gundel_1]QQV91472.1 hypothetical protein Gundel1_4 [Tenacibaculum phage Gundel_1]